MSRHRHRNRRLKVAATACSGLVAAREVAAVNLQQHAPWTQVAKKYINEESAGLKKRSGGLVCTPKQLEAMRTIEFKLPSLKSKKLLDWLDYFTKDDDNRNVLTYYTRP